MKSRAADILGGDGSASRCPVCHDEMKFGQGHCTGSTLSFYRASVAETRKEGHSTYKYVPEYHHGVKHDRCWKCSGDMGCSLCVPSSAELYCRRCKVAANLETFLASGPPCGFSFDVSGRTAFWLDRSAEYPKLQAYPRQWVAAWIARCSDLGVDYEGDGRKEFVEFRKQFEALMADAGSVTPTRKELAREHERQKIGLEAKA